jgi:hypothetical protein
VEGFWGCASPKHVKCSPIGTLGVPWPIPAIFVFREIWGYGCACPLRSYREWSGRAHPVPLAQSFSKARPTVLLPPAPRVSLLRVVLQSHHCPLCPFRVWFLAAWFSPTWHAATIISNDHRAAPDATGSALRLWGRSACAGAGLSVRSAQVRRNPHVTSASPLTPAAIAVSDVSGRRGYGRSRASESRTRASRGAAWSWRPDS